MLDTILFPAPSPGYDSKLFGPRLIGIPQSGGDQMPAVLNYPSGKSKFLLFNLHGNATDIGREETEGQYLSEKLQCTVLSVEYPGYGIYNGSKNMSSIDVAVWMAFRFVVDSLKISPKDIVIYARSIGTGVAAKLASKSASQGEIVRGMVLMSPYTSILDVVQDHATCLARALFSHRWRPEVDLMKAKSPILLLHGAADTLISVSHTNNLVSKLKKTTKKPSYDKYITVDRAVGVGGAYSYPLSVRISSKADHNRWDFEVDIVAPLMTFLNELPSESSWSRGVYLREILKAHSYKSSPVGRSSSCIS